MRYFEEKIELNGFSVPFYGYIPVNPREISAYKDRRPAVIVLPGGGYSGLANHEGEPIALRFAAQGICAFVLKYSVKPNGAVFPQALCEALTAVKYVRDHAEEFGIDPNNIATLGFLPADTFARPRVYFGTRTVLTDILKETAARTVPTRSFPAIP